VRHWSVGCGIGLREAELPTLALFDCRSPVLDCTPFTRFSIESRQSKTPKILAGNILQRFSDLLRQVGSINAIPQTAVICVVAYLSGADWIGRLVS
jgi:hypothetical protein